MMPLGKGLTMVVLSVLLATGAVAAAGCVGRDVAALVPEDQAQIIEGITAQEEFGLIQENQNNPDFVIIDLRWPQEFSNGHIEGAINMDFHSETFRDELNQLNRNKTYLIYPSCACGGIGWKALGIMKELDFREAYNMWGGFQQWE